VRAIMSDWNQQHLHTHMHIYSSDNLELGHISHIYEDSFALQKGLLFHKNLYIPYSAIAAVENEQVHLLMTKDEITGNTEWESRPDYENHLGDPVQLTYDRGHGVHDPFDETTPEQR
jgi:hypothetical protein